MIFPSSNSKDDDRILETRHHHHHLCRGEWFFFFVRFFLIIFIANKGWKYYKNLLKRLLTLWLVVLLISFFVSLALCYFSLCPNQPALRYGFICLFCKWENQMIDIPKLILLRDNFFFITFYFLFIRLNSDWIISLTIESAC